MDLKHLSTQNYVKGFAFSLALTLGVYFLVHSQAGAFGSLFARHFIIFLILLMAVIQLIVQLVYFLHLSRDSSQRWNLAVFSFMLIVLFILVLGSLWIMYNLNYGHAHSHEMSGSRADKYLIKDEGL